VTEDGPLPLARMKEVLMSVFSFSVTSSADPAAPSCDRLPALRERWRLDCVVINGENAAGGFGITEAICDEILQAGADAITLGNHAFDQREALVFIERQHRLVRPATFPKGTPGRGATMIETGKGARVLVVNAMGRIFIDAMDDPFAAVEEALEACPLGADARMRSSSISTRRRRARSRRWACSATAAQPRRRHAYACPHRRSPHPAGRHGLYVRCRGCAAITIRCSA
jgi:2',3'-cyclic-nucleotide 2'-phosphodiesterase